MIQTIELNEFIILIIQTKIYSFIKFIKMEKSTNLHDFQHEIFLGFVSQQPLEKVDHQVSFIGGQPFWLKQPNQKLLICEQCSGQNQLLTFLGQIFCPLNAKHCYNRILYMFYCEKCRRCFRCIKQQTDQNWQPKQIKQTKKWKQVRPQSYQIQSDPMERKQILKIINRAKIEVQQEIIMQQDDDDSQDQQGQQIVNIQKMTGDEFMKKVSELQKIKQSKQYTQKQIEQINKKFQSLKIQQKQKQEKEGFKEIQKKKKDHLFEQYKKVMKNINDPVMIYSNIPIPYNLTTLNPKHNCKYCKAKLQLQTQITQKVLLFHKSLAVLDWGSIFIYTCTASCQQSEQQCVVLQYELDAISQQQISKLKKTKKNRKKNKNKSLSKQKRKMQQKCKLQPELIQNRNVEQNDKQEEGDWD